MMLLATTVLLASLIGSPHCGGMCGGIAAFCGGAGQCNLRTSVVASCAYHAARLLAYGSVGMLAGMLGGLLNAGGALIGLQQSTAIAAGIAIALYGCALLMQAGGVDMGRMPLPQWIKRGLARVYAVAGRCAPVQRATLIGLATPLLPCGWLWSFAAVSAGSGGALEGGLVMVMFWIGTVPVLAVVGGGIAAMGGSQRRAFAALSGAAMIGVGVYTAGVRAQLAPSVARVLDTTEFRIPSASDTDAIAAIKPACCTSAEAAP